MQKINPESRLWRVSPLNIFNRWQAIDHGVFFYLALIILVLVLLRFWFSTFPADDFSKNVQVEMVGFLLDIVFLGLGFYLFTLWYQRKQDIKRWQEEIDDFRAWNEPEAMYRIVENIKRLNRAGVTAINLSGCYLKKADLTSINLTGSLFFDACLVKTDFSYSILDKVRFGATDLRKSILIDTKFKNASFAGVNLEGAWLENLLGLRV